MVLAAAVFWLVIWQIAAMAVGQEIIIASPLRVVQVLAKLVVTASFWTTAATTTWHIVVGFLVAVAAGTILAWLASLNRWVAALIGPPLRAMRSVPVVSFIILLLIWGGSAWLSGAVAALMVTPVVFDNVAQGLARVPVELREMTRVFAVSRWRAWLGVTAPAVMPYLIAACQTGVGLAWKAGVSAEVIGLPQGTIGERLNTAKLYLATGDLFAWTVVIVVLGLVTERVAVWALGRAEHAFEHSFQRADPVTPTHFARFAQDDGNERPAHDTQPRHPARSVAKAQDLPSPPIEVHDVTVAYGDHVVLSDISCDIPDGGVLRIAGPNGAGKSTLLKVVLGLVKPISGDVSGVAGRRAAAVFQENRLCPWLGAIGNLRLVVPTLTRGDAEAALTSLGLAAEDLARPVRQLSGGQQRRVAIARALAAPADIVCLDEPFTGIDAASLDGVIAQLKARLQGKTVLLVTHDDAQAAVFVAHAGQILRLR